MNKPITIQINKFQLDSLIDALIESIWHIKDVVLGKERSTFGTDLKGEEPITEEEQDLLRQYGYYLKKELLDKLKQIEFDFFGAGDSEDVLA